MASKKTSRRRQSRTAPEPNAQGVSFDLLRSATIALPPHELERTLDQQLDNSLLSPIYSTGMALGGTIGVLDQKIQNLAHLVTRRSFLAGEFRTIQGELISIKTDVLPQLQESRQTLAKVEKYMRDNTSFLTDLASSRGRLQAIEAYVNSVSKRLEMLEGQKTAAWNKTINVLTLAVAIISILIAVYAALRP